MVDHLQKLQKLQKNGGFHLWNFNNGDLLPSLTNLHTATAPLSKVSKYMGDDEQALMVRYVAVSMGVVKTSIIRAEDNGEDRKRDQTNTNHNIQRRLK